MLTRQWEWEKRMQYQQEPSNDIKINNRIKKINDDLALCLKVENTLSSEGWKDIIEPIVKKMVFDITGGELNGKWINGILDRARKDERREFYIGYKQALIDLMRRIYAYKEQIEIKKSELKMVEDEKVVRYHVPMNDTNYNLRG